MPPPHTPHTLTTVTTPATMIDLNRLDSVQPCPCRDAMERNISSEQSAPTVALALAPESRGGGPAKGGASLPAGGPLQPFSIRRPFTSKTFAIAIAMPCRCHCHSPTSQKGEQCGCPTSPMIDSFFSHPDFCRPSGAFQVSETVGVAIFLTTSD